MLLNRYEVLEEVGSGNFSSVSKARDASTGQQVAIKKMRSHHKIGLREGLILRGMEHPNIVRMYDFHQEGEQTLMVLELMPQNTLELYESQPGGLSEEQVKCILFQVAAGLAYVHQKGIIHRDLKPQNILIDTASALTKIIDFGLAVPLDRISTDYVATRWYRAPENLLGTKEYTSAIDVFALACVAVELYLATPLFPGTDNIDQLHRIFGVLGDPTPSTWLLGSGKFEQFGLKGVQERKLLGLDSILKAASPQFTDLISKMLVLNPAKRITSWEILEHPYFKGVYNIIPPQSYQRYIKDLQKKKQKSVQEVSQPFGSNLRNIQMKSPGCKPEDNARNCADFKSNKATQKHEQKIQKSQIQPILSFRGFHPVKAAKMSVRQSLQAAGHRSPGPYRNPSVNFLQKQNNKHITYLKGVIQSPALQTSRRISAERKYFSPVQMTSFRQHTREESSFKQGDHIGKELGEFQQLNAFGQALKSNRIMTVQKQSSRVSRNISDASSQNRKVNLTNRTFVMPNFVKQRTSPDNLSKKIPKNNSNTRNLYEKHSMDSSVVGSKFSLYTDPFARENLINKQLNDHRTFKEKAGKLQPVQGGKTQLIKLYSPLNSNRSINPAQMSGRGRIGYQLESHLRQITSVERNRKEGSRLDPSPLSMRRESVQTIPESLSQRPSVLMLQGCPYREPRLSTGKAYGQRARGPKIEGQEVGNKNISINLNLSFVQGNRSRRGRV